MQNRWICTEVTVWADDSDTLYELIAETLDPMRTIVRPPIPEALIEFAHVEDMVAMKLALSEAPSSMGDFAIECDEPSLEMGIAPCHDQMALAAETARVCAGRATVHQFERHPLEFADREMRDRLDRALTENADRFRDPAASNAR